MGRSPPLRGLAQSLYRAHATGPVTGPRRDGPGDLCVPRQSRSILCSGEGLQLRLAPTTRRHDNGRPPSRTANAAIDRPADALGSRELDPLRAAASDVVGWPRPSSTGTPTRKKRTNWAGTSSGRSGACVSAATLRPPVSTLSTISGAAPISAPTTARPTSPTDQHRRRRSTRYTRPGRM